MTNDVIRDKWKKKNQRSKQETTTAVTCQKQSRSDRNILSTTVSWLKNPSINEIVLIMTFVTA